MLIISSDLRSLKDGHSRRVLPKWSTTTSDSEHPKPRTRGTDGNSTSSGEGSIYPYPHGFRAYVWVTTSTGRKQRKYVSGKTRDEVREKYLALHQAARRGPVASSVPTLARYLEGWLADVVRPTLAPKTATNYEIFSRLYIIPGIGSKRLDKLSVRCPRSFSKAK
jgi:Phage integrase, N-terminal SAM-like domain